MMVEISVSDNIVSDDAVMCTSILSKARGLMFRKTPRTLIFKFSSERIVPLHMWFVFFPIDIIFLDKDRKVVEIKENFLPWSYYRPKRRSMFVIEFPSGTISCTGIKSGDQVTFR